MIEKVSAKDFIEQARAELKAERDAENLERIRAQNRSHYAKKKCEPIQESDCRKKNPLAGSPQKSFIIPCCPPFILNPIAPKKPRKPFKPSRKPYRKPKKPSIASHPYTKRTIKPNKKRRFS